MAEMQEFFAKKYDVFNAQQSSLQNAGIANSVQLQELVQATVEELSRLQQQQDNQQSTNAALLKWLKQRTTAVILIQ
jgi:hypothetical protein